MSRSLRQGLFHCQGRRHPKRDRFSRPQDAFALLKHIGQTLSTQRQMVGHVEIDDKPELLWEMPEFERLYLRLEDDYEIQERYERLNRKLDLIYRTAETMHGLLQGKSSLRVEWYIVILIVVDILLHLAEKYLGL